MTRHLLRQLPTVLDTNIVLDLFLFDDPRCELLRERLQAGELIWIATPHMKGELERVLTYSHIQAKLAFYKKQSSDILKNFDALAQMHSGTPPQAPCICKDSDDQAFIDLAYDLAQTNGHAQLFSKDKAVLALRKRLLAYGVQVLQSLAQPE